MSCCASHSDHEKKKEESKLDKPPKSFVSKYLYKLGKEDFEKSKGKAKKDCC